MKIKKNTLFLALGTIMCFGGCFVTGNFTLEKSTEQFLINLIWKCSKTEDINFCLKSKAVNFLNKLVQMKEPVFINEYLSFTKNEQSDASEDEDEYKSVLNVENTSVESKEDKNEELDKIIWKKLTSFFKTRDIHLTFPSETFEGRSKEGKIFKKSYGIFFMAAMMGGMMLKLALEKIALIAGKALVIGKIALILTLLISLKKFSEHRGGEGGEHAEVIYASSEHGGRSLAFGPTRQETANNLAYQAHLSKDLEIL